MAGAIVTAILDQLKTITIDKASTAWSLVRGVEEEVKKLESNFKELQLEVEDAEEREYLDKRLKHWLDKLKDVSYEMEDVLDEWEVAVQQLQRDSSSDSICPSVPCFSAGLWKVCPFVSCFSVGAHVVRRHDIATKIKQINEELDDIVKDQVRVELIKGNVKQPKRYESTSFVDVSELIGRTEVTEDIIKILQSEEKSQNVPTITIQGMGGIGKTSLAQLVYHDKRIQDHFKKIVWVCASDPFDQCQIAISILDALDSDSLRALTFPTLQNVLQKISEKLKTTKSLIVFDDVWTDRDDDWRSLKATFKCGVSGSWILVTTRIQSVARQLESAHVVPLSVLSEKMCWSILAQKALSGRNRVDRENLEDIGRKIAKKCGGLPLVAKILGGLLQDKRGREEWENVLNSGIWKSSVAQNLFSPLLMSYYDLPSPIRQCLLYCAIFPKSHKISKDELIPRWMAQGYLNCDARRELIGEDYFKYLATRSFFQDFGEDDHGSVTSCHMHDMVHEFVQFLAEQRITTQLVVENLMVDLSSKKARHLRLVIPRSRSSPLSIYGIENLRSLVVESEDKTGEASGDGLHDLFSRSKLLRLLELDSIHLEAKEISRGMEILIYLRYLSFRCCPGLKNLPEAVCELINLQYLNLQDCWNLVELPVGIGKLINLKYFSTEGCHELTYYPKGVRNLTSLIRLTGCVIRTKQSVVKFSIGDLENLDLLDGNLSVRLIGEAIDWDDAKKAKLHNKIHLKGMDIWIFSLDIQEEEVLQALNPPSNLLVKLYRSYERSYETILRKMRIKEKIRVARIVQKAALDFIDAHQVHGSSKNTTN